MRISDWSSDVCSSDLVFGALGKPGGAEGNRTPDLCSAIAALSHLSYGPVPGGAPYKERAWPMQRDFNIAPPSVTGSYSFAHDPAKFRNHGRPIPFPYSAADIDRPPLNGAQAARTDRKKTRMNSSHQSASRMASCA